MDTNNTNNTNNYNTNINLYNEKMSEYMARIGNNGILLEITKCCGYSEIHPFHKDITLAELHTNVIQLFELYRENPTCNLYTRNSDGIYSLIEKSDANIKTFIQNNNMKPIYELPAKVVYRIFLDDGHIHPEETTCNFLNVVT